MKYSHKIIHRFFSETIQNGKKFIEIKFEDQISYILFKIVVDIKTNSVISIERFNDSVI
mgnify:CR=1 FL=1